MDTTATMPTDVIDRVRELREAVSSGPWRWNEGHAVYDNEDTRILECGTVCGTCADASLAALAPTLARCVEEMWEALDNANCHRVARSGFMAGTCNWDKLPLEKRCSRCAALANVQRWLTEAGL